MVKTVRFAKPGYVGDPLNAVRIFNEKEVDELVVLDIMASKEGRGPDLPLLARMAEECFMPLCYGGGVAGLGQMHELFALGIEKISLNTAPLDDMSVLSRAADRFGSQSVVFSIDCKRGLLGGAAVYSHAGRNAYEKDPVALARQAQAAGAGEILLNSVDRDGMRQGFDLELVRAVAKAVTIPVVACGGGGELAHFRQVIREAGAAAAAGGSQFVYQGKHRAVLITYPKPEEIEAI
ncbi:MAG: AglZ/HisF2 family acetamidino modification protein [Burkholderiaceae bacterium]|nr:AglZ/HisF2 family acetamidino modification protein [Burkholderiaceae bacterium]